MMQKKEREETETLHSHIAVFVQYIRWFHAYDFNSAIAAIL